MSMLQTEPFSLAWQPTTQVAMFTGCASGSTHSTQCPNCKCHFQCPQLSPNGGGGGGIMQSSIVGPLGPHIMTNATQTNGLVRTQCCPSVTGGQQCLVPCFQNPNHVVFSQGNQLLSQPGHLLVRSPSFASRPKRTTLRSQLSGGGLVTVSASGETGADSSSGLQLSPGFSPQSTPVAQLAFEMPPFAMDNELKQRLLAAIDQPLLVPVKGPSQLVPEKELQSLTDNLKALRQSGWYYEGISFQESQELLKHTKVGTFLVRNSSDPQFLFTLSVQTDRGPTSVRLHYIDGYFRLDSQPHLQPVMRAFPSVIELIEYYVYLFKFKFFRDSEEHVWVDGRGKWYSAIKLEVPLRKKEEPPTLKHLARMAIHKSIQSSGKPRIPKLPPPHSQLELPKSLVDYLSEYPHSI